MNRRCLLIGLALLGASAAEAATWMHVTYAANGADVAIDRDALEPKDGWVRAWVRFDYSKVRSERARGLLLRQEFNCNGKFSRVVSSVTYAPDGSVLAADDRPSDYAPAKPGSVSEGVGKVVCALGASQAGR